MRGTEMLQSFINNSKIDFHTSNVAKKRSKKVGHHPGTIIILLFAQRRRSLDIILYMITA